MFVLHRAEIKAKGETPIYAGDKGFSAGLTAPALIKKN